jgi:hypothetical protein
MLRHFTFQKFLISMPAFVLALTCHAAAQDSSGSQDFGLSRDPTLRVEKHVTLAVCFSKDGSVTDVKVVSGTGDVTQDAAIVAKMRQVKAGKPPPADMPPCINMTIAIPTSANSTPPSGATQPPASRHT